MKKNSSLTSLVLTLPRRLIIAVTYRFGWFMSSSVVSEQWNVSHSIADHWRALQLYDMSRVFDLSDKQDMLKYLSRPDVSSSLSYCDDLSSDCHNGFYQSPQCRHQHSDDCAVLLSSYPGNLVCLAASVIIISYPPCINLVMLDHLLAGS